MTSKKKELISCQVAAKQIEISFVMINILKQQVRTRTDIEKWPSGYSFPMLYSYVAC